MMLNVLLFRPCQWETVRLRNVCVKDWSEFARFLEQRNTKTIDLRKMRLKKMDVKKVRLPLNNNVSVSLEFNSEQL